MSLLALVSTRCAICRTEGNTTQLYPANFRIEDLNPAVFSARRLPDNIHYRVVRCHSCGLVRSDPVLAPDLLASLYAQSAFTYEANVPDLACTYGRYLANLERYGANKDTLLEIGCGSGFFLEEALNQGYCNVRGIEPSRKAVDLASIRLQGHIVCGFMEPGIFDQGQFDAVCLFQVFDHILNPGDLLDECFRLLKPNGLMLCINHNIEALSARILKERSPIIDIEHTYLYSPWTMSRIFRIHGFHIRRIGAAWNTFSLRYITRLVPLPAYIKQPVLLWMRKQAFDRIRLTVPLGNMVLIAQKPNISSTVTG